jgi:hypothetical protein
MGPSVASASQNAASDLPRPAEGHRVPDRSETLTLYESGSASCLSRNSLPDRTRAIALLAFAARLACTDCGATPCGNPSFCAACRIADQKAPRRQDRVREQRPTPQTTIEAIMYCVSTRGTKALHEPANLERLSRCDDAALAQIDARINRLKEGGR